MTNRQNQYGHAFQAEIAAGSLHSAAKIVPLLAERFRPTSVVDVGCGSGTWLSAWLQQGVEDVLGLDGDYVPQDLLRIPREHFTSTDLSRPFSISRRFDLATSLEVAEHLQEDRAAGFVRDLCALSDVVIFGAAIPWQGGVSHVNCRWQSYWAELFAAEGYGVHDWVRPAMWNEDEVEWWYRQNTLVYVRGDSSTAGPLDLVHPKFFHDVMSTFDCMGLRDELHRLPSAARRFAMHRLGRVPR